jgi:hypothetical protein
LATGAVTIGVGAALAMGAGVAEADTDASAKTSVGTGAQHQAGQAGPHAKLKTKAAASPAMTSAAVVKPSSRPPRRSLATTPARVQSALPPVQVPQLPTPQMVIQQVVNVVVPLMNNTPIRNILDAVDPPTPGTSVVRLLGQPVSTVLSDDGTRAYVTTTNAFGSIPILGLLVGSVSTVNVIDTATNTIVGVPWVTQSPPADLKVTPDGTRAVRQTYSTDTETTTITVSYPNTGSVIGSPIAVAGKSYSGLVLSPDNTRAYLSVSTNASTDAVAVIDLEDGTLVAPPVEIEGFPYFGVTVSPDGSRVAQVSQANASVIMTMIDPDTGGVVGEPIVFANAGPDTRTAAMFSQDGARVSLITTPFDPVTFERSRVLTVFDSATGEIVGSPVVLPGYALTDGAAVVPDPSGDRIFVVGGDWTVDGGDITYVTVVDTSSSTVVGDTAVIAGDFVIGSLVVSPDKQRAYQTTTFSSTSDVYSAVSAVDTDGTLVNEPTRVDGFATAPVTLSLDGSRAYQPTSVLGGVAVTAIDTGTGAVVGVPQQTRGLTNDPVLLTPDGSQAFLSSSVTVLQLLIPIIPPFGYWIILVPATRFTAFNTAAF